LAWQGYTVERRSPGGGFAVITHVGAGATFVDRQVAAGKTYTYRVQADDGFGASPYTNEATVTVGAPTPPADVRTTVVSDARVDVSWTDASDDETQFEIERRAGSGAFQPLATIAANKTIFSDATVAASTAYAYRVRALNATGASPYATSPRVKPSAAPLFAPGAPCCLGAETQQSNAGPHVLLRWTDLVSNETGFRVERKESKADASWLLLAELPPSATLFADRTAVSGTLYVYRVVAYDAGGVSAGDEVVVRAP
jgi:titin